MHASAQCAPQATKRGPTHLGAGFSFARGGRYCGGGGGWYCGCACISPRSGGYTPRRALYAWGCAWMCGFGMPYAAAPPMCAPCICGCAAESAAKRWREHAKAAHAPLPPARGRSAALVRPQPRLLPRELAPAARQRRTPDPCPACGCSPRPASEGAVHSAGSPRAACGRLRGRARTRSPAVAARRTFSVDSCCMSCETPKNPQPKCAGHARPPAKRAAPCAPLRSRRAAAQPAQPAPPLAAGWPGAAPPSTARISSAPCSAALRGTLSVITGARGRRASASRHAPVMRSSSSRSVDSRR
jgi:hypothetical protein